MVIRMNSCSKLTSLLLNIKFSNKPLPFFAEKNIKSAKASHDFAAKNDTSIGFVSTARLNESLTNNLGPVIQN